MQGQREQTLREQIGGSRYPLLARFKKWEKCLAECPEWRQYGLPKYATELKPLEALRAFAQFVAIGVYPPGPLLLRVAEGIAAFLDGENTLDSALQVRSKKRAGNPVDQEARQRRIENRLWEIAVYRVEHPGATIENAASTVCSLHGIVKPDADSFARYYKNRGKGRRLEQQYRLIKEFEQPGK